MGSGWTGAVHKTSVDKGLAGVRAGRGAVYLVPGQEVRTIELIVLQVEGPTSLESDPKSRDAGGLGVDIFAWLGAPELALRVVGSRRARSSPAARMVGVGGRKGVSGLRMVRLVVVVAAVERGRHGDG